MTRKNKILIFAGVVAGGALVWAFWPVQEEGKVRVHYSGVWTNNPNYVLFGITSGRKTMYISYFGWVEERTPPGQTLPDPHARHPRMLKAKTLEIFEYPVPSTNPWKAVVFYSEVDDSFMFRTRRRLIAFATDHNWSRIAGWLYPQLDGGEVDGPVMLGNKPAVPDKL